MATVLNNGQVTAKNPGSTILTVTDQPSGLQATTRLTVSGSPLHTLNVTTLQMTGTLPGIRLGYASFDYSRFVRVDPVTHKILVAQTGISPATIFRYATQGSRCVLGLRLPPAATANP